MTTVSLLILSLAAGTASANPSASRGVLLDFSATWCGPCQQMSPIVSRLKRQGYPVRKVDVDQERALAQKFNVRSIPAFILVVDGKERMRYEGATSESQLRRMLAQIPHDPKPSVLSNPDPRQVIGPNPRRSLPRREIQVAENTEPKPVGGGLGGFTFPFGGKKSAEPNSPAEPPAEPAVIRAKLDQDKPLPQVTLEENPLASSVRVRIAGKDGMNYGSGTIIESRPGQTLILTCGHIFRDLKPDAKIEVDLFTSPQAETFVGKTIAYDLEGDVGLLSIATDARLPASPLASLADEAQVRQSVYSIGCGGGETPSREDVFVTALNRYLGPDNIECTGEPLQGRSGGGLFNAQGNVVGVCVAADPKNKRGLYAGLKVIHNLLKEHNFAASDSSIHPARTARDRESRRRGSRPTRPPGGFALENRRRERRRSEFARRLGGPRRSGGDLHCASVQSAQVRQPGSDPQPGQFAVCVVSDAGTQRPARAHRAPPPQQNRGEQTRTRTAPLRPSGRTGSPAVCRTGPPRFAGFANDPTLPPLYSLAAGLAPVAEIRKCTVSRIRF